MIEQLLDWLGFKDPTEEDDVPIEDLGFSESVAATVNPVAPSFADNAPDAGELSVELRSNAGKTIFLDRLKVGKTAPAGALRVAGEPATKIDVGVTDQCYQEFKVAWSQIDKLPFDLPEYLTAKNADYVIFRWSCR